MRLVPLLLSLLPLMAMGNAQASESVQFRSAAVPPTAFKVRLAKERGETVVPEPTTELSGELFRPPGEGPFPAIVWLHDCLGHLLDDEQRLAEHFASQYVVLFVDSFGPRGRQRGCTRDSITAYPLVDAVGALDYLAAKPFVRPDRIAVIGTYQAGATALMSVRRSFFEHLTKNRFAAAIAYYPADCFSAVFVAPTLVLVGERDELTPAKYCRQMIAYQETLTGIVSRLAVYPGAYHWFNQRRIADKPEMYLDHRMEYDAAADQAALQDITRFLREHVGR